MNILVSKHDLLWSYAATFFNISSGVLVLPLVLRLLSTEEIAMNYMMMTIGSIVLIIDFGFSPQFGRNFSYVYSGAQNLKKEGLTEAVSQGINFHLLKTLIYSARRVYTCMSFTALFLMLTFGTWYIYIVTHGFTIVQNAIIVWVIFSISTFFQIYFSYYSSLLTGRGLIKEQKKALFFSRLLYIILSFLLLLSGVGLVGLCIANLLAPFAGRALSHYYFFDNETKASLAKERATKKESKELTYTLWYNAKKVGIVTIGSFAALQFSMFVAGLCLSPQDVASYGLMMQLTNVISIVSTTFFMTMVPQLTSYLVSHDSVSLTKYFVWAVNIYYVMFILSAITFLLFGTPVLNLIGAHALLPPTYILLAYLVVVFLENNHSIFSSFISMGNTIPYTKVAIISGTCICIGDIIVLYCTDWKLLGLVLVQGVVQLAYNNWYWPKWVLKDLNISLFNFITMGFKESYNHRRRLLNVFTK